jgi:hypothetical protein
MGVVPLHNGKRYADGQLLQTLCGQLQTVSLK